MKVYVLYKYWGWDGYSSPHAVTDSRAEADSWRRQDEENCFDEFELKGVDE